MLLGRAMCGDGSLDTEIRRITAVANAWKKVEGVKRDSRISRKHKGHVLSSCVTTAYMNVLETVALTEKQQEKVQVCEEQC